MVDQCENIHFVVNIMLNIPLDCAIGTPSQCEQHEYTMPSHDRLDARDLG